MSAPADELENFHDSIPHSARLPDQDVLWVNSKGQTKQRQVIGDRILLRQQPAAPPPEPEILLFTDQVLIQFQTLDKYIKCVAMIGYTIKDFANDIRESMFDIKYKYVVVHMETLQLGQKS